MTPFFVLVFLAGLAVGNLMLAAIRALKVAAPVLPTGRRRPFLTAARARALRQLEQAAGDQRRVLPEVPLTLLIAPLSYARRRQAARWSAAIAGLQADFAVVTRDGSEPLCAVLLTAAGKQPRKVRAAQQRVRKLCLASDLPVLTLGPVEPTDALAARLQELLWPLEERLNPVAELASEDEDALLAGLAAAVRDDAVTGAARR